MPKGPGQTKAGMDTELQPWLPKGLVPCRYCPAVGKGSTEQLRLSHGLSWGPCCSVPSVLTPLQTPVVHPLVGLLLWLAELTSTVQHPGHCREAPWQGLHTTCGCVCLEAAALSPAPSKAKVLSYSIPHPLTSTSHYNSMSKTFPLSFVHLFSPHTALWGLERNRSFVPGAISAVTAWECNVGAKFSHPAWPC